MISSGRLEHSIGVKIVKDGRECCSNLIFKDTILPTGVRRSYTVQPGVESLEFSVLCNDSMESEASMDKCQELGKISVKLPEGTSGGDVAETVFTAGLNRLFIITVACNGKRSEGFLKL